MYIKAISKVSEDELLSKAIKNAQSLYSEWFENKTITGYKIDYNREDPLLLVHWKHNCECNCENCIAKGNIEFLGEFLFSTIGLSLYDIAANTAYVYEPKHKVKRGDAIRIVRKDMDDPIHAAYNAIVVNASPKVISFIKDSSNGPILRHITAIEAFHHNVVIYKYEEPDDYKYEDSEDASGFKDVIRK